MVVAALGREPHYFPFFDLRLFPKSRYARRMKSGWQIIILAAFILLTVAVTARSQSFPLLSAAATNSPAQTFNSTNTAWDVTDTNALVKYLPPRYWTGQNREETYSNSASPLIPLIEFQEVPITVGLENLAQQAGLNYLLDPRIGYNQPDRFGRIRPEPIVSLRWENVTAEHAFITLCRNYGLTIASDTNTHVVLIRAWNHDVNYVEPNFFENDTNVIPLIEFQHVPAVVVLKALVKQAGIRCIFSALIDTGHTKNGPTLSFRWENLTAKQALAAFCENYDLNIIKYPESGIIRIEPAD
jgi:hypothetical protein